MEMADTEQQVLHHAGQWTETISHQVTALQASVSAIQDGTSKVFHEIAAHISSLSLKQSKFSSNLRRALNPIPHQNGDPDWMQAPPRFPTETHQWKNREWTFCTKCAHGKGRWVCTHTTTTHQDDFKSRRRTEQRDSTCHHHRSTYHHYGPNHPDRGSSFDRSRSRSSGGFSDRDRYSSRSRSPDIRHRVSFDHVPTPNPTAQLSLLHIINSYSNANTEN